MKIKKSSTGIKALGIGMLGVLLSGCFSSGPATVNSKSTIDYSYHATNPLTNEVLTGGHLTGQHFDVTNTQILEILSGATVGETKEALLTDPFLQHNPELVQKFPMLIIKEMGVELDPSQETLEL